MNAIYKITETDQSSAGHYLLLREGTPRSCARGRELLGAEWQFEASLDGGRTWRAFATMLSLEDRFPAE